MPQLTPLSKAGWTATADSSINGTEVPSRTIDGGYITSTNWHSGAGYPHYLQYDMGSAQTFNMFRFTHFGGFNRTPTSVELYVSDDGATWGTAIATATWVNGATQYLTFATQNKRYMKLVGTAGSDAYMACNEIDLFNFADLSLADFAPHNMTTDTAPSPFVASATNVFGGNAAYKVFDGLLGFGEYYLGTGGGADSVTLDTGSGVAHVLHRYEVVQNTQDPDSSASAPKDWTLEGSNDGSTWTVLDTITSQTAWRVGEVRYFECASPTTAYRYFKLNISDNNGDATYTAVGELYLYGVAGSPPGGGLVPVFVHHLRQQGIM